MVKKRSVCKRSGFWLGSDIWKPDLLSKTIQNPDKNIRCNNALPPSIRLSVCLTLLTHCVSVWSVFFCVSCIISVSLCVSFFLFLSVCFFLSFLPSTMRWTSINPGWSNRSHERANRIIKVTVNVASAKKLFVWSGPES